MRNEITTLDESKCLFHHGIHGQKWGKKNGPPYPLSAESHSSAEKKAGGRDSLNKKKNNSSIKKQRKKDLDNRRSMSDQELKDKIARMQLEKQYKQLIQEDISPGRKMANEILTSAGKTVLINATKGAIAYAGHAASKGEWDRKQFANYAFPNPNKK